MKASERRERLADSRLYVVSDARRERGDLAEFLDSILGAGVDIVQIREKEAEAGEVIRWGMVFKEAAEAHGALFIVNDRPDVALALDADGVHLGQDDLPVEVAQRILGPDAVIGMSTHSPEQFDVASPEADYLCAGPVWETPTKPGRPAAGLDLIRHAAKSGEERPWFAIGGINRDNLPEVLDAGAERIVVVRAVTEAVSPGEASRELARGVWRGEAPGER
jgi:thiamine-phosphate pyrophosphorylase